MATKTKNVALVYLMFILVSVVAFQLCKADDDADDDNIKKRRNNVNQNFIAVKDTATFIHRSISKATTSRIQSTDAGLAALLGIFMLALYH
ncbi:hypothetical protein MKX01_004409 [Papaver californicum]|nr:hypothetical protein MKX01_004409 [Papaver californicum]